MSKREDLKALPKLKDIPVEQMTQTFSTLYSMCCEHAKSIINEGYNDDDMEHYIYEAAMEGTLGRNIWKTINKYL